MTPRRSEDGFTLVELLVVLTLLGVIGGVVVSGLVTSMQTTRDTQSRVEAMAQLQRAAENVSRELRAACPIVGTALDDQSVTAAIRRDGAQRRHTYALDATAGTLAQDVEERAANGSWNTTVSGRVLLRDLTPGVSRFEFLDAQGADVILPGDVRTVKLNLGTTIAGGDAVVIETAVSLRNGGRSCD